jgi:hypothetical protein
MRRIALRSHGRTHDDGALLLRRLPQGIRVWIHSLHGLSRDAVKFSGPILQHRSKAASGGDAVRNSCAVCGGLVFGGEADISDSFTIYAGSLDEPNAFVPRIAIFARNRPAWALLPPGLSIFEGIPRIAG